MGNQPQQKGLPISAPGEEVHQPPGPTGGNAAGAALAVGRGLDGGLEGQGGPRDLDGTRRGNELDVANPWIHPCRILKEYINKVLNKNLRGEEQAKSTKSASKSFSRCHLGLGRAACDFILEREAGSGWLAFGVPVNPNQQGVLF